MKKGFKIFGIVVLAFIIVLATLPFLFKGKIKEKIDSEIAKSINAKVFYDPDQFSLTIFRNFPNLTLSVGDFGMIGKKEAFAGDTLMSVKQFKVVLDIMSVIKGDKIKINSIYLKQPYILTQTKKDSSFSWDITYPDTTAIDTSKAAEAPSKFDINIAKWEIEDGTIIYDDATMPVFARLNHFDHKGSGEITEAIYDVSTYTKSTEVLVSYGGVTYLNKVLLEIKADMNINMNESKYTFKENLFTINNFKFGFDGMLAMPDSNITMDIKFAAKETAFKNLISLVPAVFLKGYENLKTDGTIGFDGFAKGVKSGTTMPAFGLNLNISNAMMQYPALPTALSNINMDLKVDCKDGVINHTIIDLKKFHVDMGSNPIEAEAYVNGMNPYDIQKCHLSAQVKLEDVTKMFPMDSLTLKGLFAMDVNVKGKYSDILKLMPQVVANANLKNGYVKYDGFPEAMEDVNMTASANSDGNMATSSAILQSLRLKLDGDPFELSAKVINFNNPNYDAKFKGLIDLAKMTKLFPIEGTTLTGKIVADIETKGIMSDVTGGKYGKTSTSGTMDITNLTYVSKADLPQGVGLTSANFVFSPEKIEIKKMVGNAGKSDMNVTGYFSNYMGYLFGGIDTTIHGKMNFNSAKFDVNEWMTTDSPAPAATGPAPEETVLDIPKNIDFTLTSSIGKVLYTNMTMNDMVGDIIMKNGIIRMSGVKFGLLEGTVAMNGNYAPINSKSANFDMDMGVKNIGIKEAFKTFNTVQKLAPMAENMDGTFSTTLKTNGALGKDMMPNYDLLNANGTMVL
ncbi:MAG TPA: AsmA family protein, partial [Cytophagaceae bacterium]|nr:AsmA family protein [Cytophagaceae bacterium]